MKFDGINSVIEHKSFKRDLKKLRKRFRTLDNDLATFISTSIRAVHVLGQTPESQGHFPISGLGNEAEGIFVGKKFACKSLKGTGSRSGIRVVYQFKNKTLRLYLIEMYYKGNKETEDINRIKSFVSEESNDLST